MYTKRAYPSFTVAFDCCEAFATPNPELENFTSVIDHCEGFTAPNPELEDFTSVIDRCEEFTAPNLELEEHDIGQPLHFATRSASTPRWGSFFLLLTTDIRYPPLHSLIYGVFGSKRCCALNTRVIQKEPVWPIRTRAQVR